MNTKARFTLLGIALVALVCVAHTLEYRELKLQQARTVTYLHPAMEAQCRDPVPEKELRIWIDKRISETEGVRTCRVVPLSADDSPKTVWRKAMKL